MHTFRSSAELAAALANKTAECLRAGLDDTGRASLVVSGGRTPLQFFAQLAQSVLDWSGVNVFLADERWVPTDSERSNAALVKQHLLRGRAKKAAFSPLYSDQRTPYEAAGSLNLQLANAPRSFDAVILGMGGDGHTASLFPDAPEIGSALRADAAAAMVLTPASQPELRLSLTPNVLANTRFLALHIEGSEKREVFNKALEVGAAEEMPVRAIMRNDIQHTQVYWCP
ncbi:MAG: 6-phosphogluconolactonase [Alphaproteobacteria bacterium]|nr:6-phosphogluconolactonase [Alphaproteobacteria bacterium]